MISSALMGESALAAQLCCSDMLPCMVKQAHELSEVIIELSRTRQDAAFFRVLIYEYYTSINFQPTNTQAKDKHKNKSSLL